MAIETKAACAVGGFTERPTSANPEEDRRDFRMVFVFVKASAVRVKAAVVV
jgi:hypothetical protein